MTPDRRKALRRAKARLDPLALYPRPVRVDGVRILVTPWLFRVPGFRRFRGCATRHLILLKRPQLEDELIVHELCGHGFSMLPGSPIDGAASDDDRRPGRRYVDQRKPTASGRGASGLAGRSPVGSSSL